jgi:hypothetical protein
MDALFSFVFLSIHRFIENLKEIIQDKFLKCPNNCKFAINPENVCEFLKNI